MIGRAITAADDKVFKSVARIGWKIKDQLHG
jgi:hypothetical protein